MDILLSTDDIEWIETQYPKLKIDILNKVIEGELSFIRSYEGCKIADSYVVQISLEVESGTILPKVFETSNRISEIAKFYKKEIMDLHVNTDGSFCLVIGEKEDELFEKGFTIQEFFKKSLEPFLYQISYYEKEGYFPWGEYAHGQLGYIELYAEDKIDLDRLISLIGTKSIIKAILTNRQSSCLCDSRKKLRKCHPLLFKGINKIKIESS